MPQFAHISLAMILLTLSTTALRADAASWQAGAAAIKITPTEPLWMAGYASRDQPAQGTLTELWAKSLAIQDPTGHRVVLITLDLVGIDRQLSQTICARLANDHGLARDQITLCVSHTHTGPVVGKNLRPMHFEVLSEDQQKKILAYTDFLVEQIVAVVADSVRGMVPATLEIAHGRATFAVNRRNNPEAEVPQRRDAGRLVGPVDYDVPVLAVRREDRSLIAIVFGYACHATVLSSMEWSGDYPGFAQISLEESFPGTIALFWAGCGADQNPLPRRQVELAKKYGIQLADAVREALRGVAEPLTTPLHTTYREISLPLDTLPTTQEIQRDMESSDRFIAARARALLRQIEQGQPLATDYPYPISSWQFGDQLIWYHLGGEVVVDYSLKIKSLPHTVSDVWVAGYSNDVMAYIPSRRVWHEGGYEGATAMIYYGLPTRWAESVEEVLLGAIHQMNSAPKTGSDIRESRPE
jgi:hypothetical protein